MARRRHSSRYSSYDGSDYARRHIAAARGLRNKYGDAFDQIKTLFLNLDYGRADLLFNAYADQFGKSAYQYALKTYQKWQSGEVKMAGQTMERLLDLLPLYMTPDEKLTLIKHLRQQALKRLHKSNVALTLSSPNSMDAVLDGVLNMVRRVGEIELPSDFKEVQGWITRHDAQSLNALAEETERYIATQRLADLMVHLAMISQLRAVAASGLKMNVITTFDIPTASVTITFTKAFWKEEAGSMNHNDANFLISLQNHALTEKHKDGKITFVDYVMRTMTPEEQLRLRQIALKEGIQLDVLMQEMIIKTQAARADVNDIIDIAERLKQSGQDAHIISEHNTASGKTRIEIKSKRPCYIATACYGDYDHPDVMVFRRYRDEQLMHSILGRCFIAVYYALSPAPARQLAKKSWLSAQIRRFVLEPLARNLSKLK